jgi:hypothetical protein
MRCALSKFEAKFWVLRPFIYTRQTSWTSAAVADSPAHMHLHQPRHHHTAIDVTVDGNQRRCDDIETCIACSRLGSSSLPPLLPPEGRKSGAGEGGGQRAARCIGWKWMDGSQCVGVVGPNQFSRFSRFPVFLDFSRDLINFQKTSIKVQRVTVSQRLNGRLQPALCSQGQQSCEPATFYTSKGLLR